MEMVVSTVPSSGPGGDSGIKCPPLESEGQVGQSYPNHVGSQWGGVVPQRTVEEQGRDAAQVETADAYDGLRAPR